MTDPIDSFSAIRLAVEPPIATLALHRPEKLNAFSRQLQEEVLDALAQLESNDDVRAIILCGAGRAFSAGYDIEAGGEDDLRSVLDWKLESLSWQFSQAIWNFRKPIIAAVHGYCLGGACELAMLCDLTIATTDCKFGEPEIRFGTGSVTSAILAAALPLKIAKELLYTGGMITAQRAYEIGMVNEVVPPDQLMVRARYQALLVSKIAPTAIRLTKELVNTAYEFQGLGQLLAFSRGQIAILNGSETDEYKEFRRIRNEKGLRAALAWRDQQFVEVERLG